MCEPYVSPLSYPIYKFFHEEPLALRVDPLAGFDRRRPTRARSVRLEPGDPDAAVRPPPARCSPRRSPPWPCAGWRICRAPATRPRAVSHAGRFSRAALVGAAPARSAAAAGHLPRRRVPDADRDREALGVRLPDRRSSSWQFRRPAFAGAPGSLSGAWLFGDDGPEPKAAVVSIPQRCWNGGVDFTLSENWKEADRDGALDRAVGRRGAELVARRDRRRWPGRAHGDHVVLTGHHVGRRPPATPIRSVPDGSQENAKTDHQIRPAAATPRPATWSARATVSRSGWRASRPATPTAARSPPSRDASACDGG